MKKVYLVLLFVVCATIFAEAKTFKVDGIRYYTLNDGISVGVTHREAPPSARIGTIIGYKKSTIDIPETVTKYGITYQVKSIGKNAFSYSSIKSITIPNSITTIGDFAFSGCKNLTSIAIPSSVVSIGQKIFSNCKSLTSIAMPFGFSLSTEHLDKVNYKYRLNDYVKPLIEEEINKWQIKGEFESTAQWQIRVNEQSRKYKVDNLFAKYEREFIAKATKFANDDFRSQLKLSTYDADNQSYLITAGQYGDLLLNVPEKSARSFKDGWFKYRRLTAPEFILSGDDMILKSVTFRSDTDVFKYDGKSEVKHATTTIDYNFNPINLEDSKTLASNNESGIGKNKIQIEQKKITVGGSDVDVNIPQTSLKNENTFAVIIANEKYSNVSNVDYAAQDGRIFAEYCKQTLGIPQKNIKLIENATLGTIVSNVDWLHNILKVYGGSAKAIFYYSGHGIPNHETGESYLLPTDCPPNNYSVAYKLQDLYDKLGSESNSNVTYFIDACFSGTKRQGEVMVAARGVAIKAKPSSPVGSSVVFSAATGDQTAFAYDEKRHGIFTYFLLKKLQESKGQASYGELADYIRSEVAKVAIVERSVSQTPTITHSSSLQDSWQGWKFIK